MWGKRIGFVLIILGISLLIFVFFLFYKDSSRILSPVPDEQGAKVIYLSPSPTK
jgi:hypothetical protein